MRSIYERLAVQREVAGEKTSLQQEHQAQRSHGRRPCALEVKGVETGLPSMRRHGGVRLQWQEQTIRHVKGYGLKLERWLNSSERWLHFQRT